MLDYELRVNDETCSSCGSSVIFVGIYFEGTGDFKLDIWCDECGHTELVGYGEVEEE